MKKKQVLNAQAQISNAQNRLECLLRAVTNGESIIDTPAFRSLTVSEAISDTLRDLNAVFLTLDQIRS
jgi:hypothetical protein